MKKKLAPALRKPIPLKVDGALGSLLTRMVQVDPVKIALLVLLEERGLDGKWTIQITGAQLVPLPDAPSTTAQNGEG